MSEPARSNGSQPMLNAEWLRQPEVVELVQHMAAFAAALMSSWSSTWGDGKPDAGYDPPGPDYSGIPKGSGKEMQDYLRNEAKRAATDTSAGFESLSTEGQRRYVDGIRDGSVREDSGSWQRGLEYDRRDAQIDKDVNTQVYGSPAGEGGPDVASAPHGGMRARAE